MACAWEDIEPFGFHQNFIHSLIHSLFRLNKPSIHLDEDARKFYLIDNLDNDMESLTTLDATTSKSIFPLKRFSTFSLLPPEPRAKFKWTTRRHSMTSFLHHNSFNSCKLFCCHDPSKVSHRTKAEVVIMVKVFWSSLNHRLRRLHSCCETFSRNFSI